MKRLNGFGVRALSFVSLLAIALTNALPAGAQQPALGKGTIVVAHGSWSTSRTYTALTKLMLEKIGYKVELKQLDTGLIYQTLATGNADIFSSAWLRGQDSYFNRLGDKLDLISMSYGPAPGGLVVPSYVAINSVEDLKKPDVKALFNGKIIGIDAGTGIMINTKAVIENYGLDMELVASSGAAMSAAFKAAYDKKQPVIVTGWCPTAMCALFDVKFLDDPKHIYGNSRNWHVARKGFRSDSPRATVFLSRFTLSEAQVSRMLVWVDNEGIKVEQAAQRFIDENPELIWYMINDLTTGMTKPKSLQ